MSFRSRRMQWKDPAFKCARQAEMMWIPHSVYSPLLCLPNLSKRSTSTGSIHRVN
jgi:hypothetical protein